MGLPVVLTIGFLQGWIVGLNSGMKVVLTIGLTFSMMSAFLYGLLAVIQHFILRLILWLSGNIRWNYAKFFAHTRKHKFIQRVGGRYQFMHELLQKHFAEMS